MTKFKRLKAKLGLGSLPFKAEKSVQKFTKSPGQNSTANKKLIFDIGLHVGLDAKYYIAKGFHVVGVEASNDLCEKVKIDMATELANGDLQLVENALHETSGQRVSFFVNPEKDDWGSLFKGAAEKGVGTSTEISVRTISLDDLFQNYGHPYYIKCDIEGGDTIFVKSLLKSGYRPEFVSIEANSADDIATLLACGYDRFQIVNQYMNPFTRCPNPSSEGNFVDAKFNREMSGLFGMELPDHKWEDFTTTVRKYIDWRDLLSRDSDLAIGWLDVHCTNSATLKK